MLFQVYDKVFFSRKDMGTIKSERKTQVQHYLARFQVGDIRDIYLSVVTKKSVCLFYFREKKGKPLFDLVGRTKKHLLSLLLPPQINFKIDYTHGVTFMTLNVPIYKSSYWSLTFLLLLKNKP